MYEIKPKYSKVFLTSLQNAMCEMEREMEWNPKRETEWETEQNLKHKIERKMKPNQKLET